MISLNNILLSPHLSWDDEFAFSPVAQMVRRTIGGGLVTFSAPLAGGRPITLTATIDQGWITKDMVDSINAMQSSVAAIYPLSINGFTANVMFRHHESPAFVAKSILRKQVPDAGDYYTCTLKLITV